MVTCLIIIRKKVVNSVGRISLENRRLCLPRPGVTTQEDEIKHAVVVGTGLCLLQFARSDPGKVTILDHLIVTFIMYLLAYRDTPIEVVVTDDKVDEAVRKILKIAKTGQMGDGKLFISNIEDAIRIRTEESGDDALI